MLHQVGPQGGLPHRFAESVQSIVSCVQTSRSTDVSDYATALLDQVLGGGPPAGVIVNVHKAHLDRAARPAAENGGDAAGLEPRG